MDVQRSAQIQVVLEGVRLPASRDELVAYAATHDSAVANELRALPEREYRRLDEVGEELAQVQPHRVTEERLPRAESGAPPGADDYLRTSTTSGAVRDTDPPTEVLERQSEAQKKQQQ